VLETVDCSMHLSPTIITATNLESNEQRCPSEVSDIAVSPVDRCRVVISISRCRPVVLTVAATSFDGWYLQLYWTSLFTAKRERYNINMVVGHVSRSYVEPVHCRRPRFLDCRCTSLEHSFAGPSIIQFFVNFQTSAQDRTLLTKLPWLMRLLEFSSCL